MSHNLTVALPKGRLLQTSLALFADIGIDVSSKSFDGRKLYVDADGLRFIAVKAWDVPVYVEYGIADLGVAGGDVLAERGNDVVVPLNLGFGRCRMAVAAPGGATAIERGSHIRVATKYPLTAQRHFAARGLSVEIIELQGSVELGIVLGLADRIVDIVETGNTLAANGLVIEEDIASHEAHMIVCRSSMITQTEQIQSLLQRVGGDAKS